MIRNILFDCADTLLRFHSKEDLAVGLGDPARAERIHNALLRSEIWGKYDNGIVDEDEIKRVVLPTLPEEDREIAVEYRNGMAYARLLQLDAAKKHTKSSDSEICPLTIS